MFLFPNLFFPSTYTLLSLQSMVIAWTKTYIVWETLDKCLYFPWHKNLSFPRTPCILSVSDSLDCNWWFSKWSKPTFGVLSTMKERVTHSFWCIISWYLVFIYLGQTVWLQHWWSHLNAQRKAVNMLYLYFDVCPLSLTAPLITIL